VAIYTRSTLRARINGRLHNKIGKVSSVNDEINVVLHDVWSEMKLRSSKRKAATPSRLFNDVYTYAAPADLNGTGIIGFQRQTEERSRWEDWQLVTEEEFDRYKGVKTGIVAIADRDLVRKLKVSLNASEESTTITPFDSTTSGLASSAWAAVGDATNLVADTDNYVEGVGSLKFDIGAGATTTAGVTASTVSTYDLTDFKAAGSAFCWIYIVSATDLTNFILQVGSDSSNYYSMTATTTNENASFTAGWNLIRWDFSGKTTTGTPDDDACDYVSLYMTKTAGKISEEGYRVDGLVIHTGEIWNTIYYSNYPWQSAAGVWKVDSTLDTDYLNLDADEYALVVEACVAKIGLIAREYDDAKIAEDYYQARKESYQMRYPAEELLMTSSYYDFENGMGGLHG
jgi:hypothetical protein